MINITLPNFFHFYDINSDLVKLHYNHPEYFFENIKFIAYEGHFPYSYLSLHNYNRNTIEYNALINFLHQADKPLVFDCGNPLLTETDMLDSYQNLILKSAENGANNIIISNPKLLTILSQKYPYYQFIGSEYYFSFDPNYEQLDKLKRVKCHWYSEELEKLPKNKVEIILTDCCYNNKQCL
jgi:hypothetical protein